MPEKSSQSQGPLTASVEKLRHELDHWLEVAWEQGERALDAIRMREGDRSWTPAVDVVESTDIVFVDVDLPGIDPKTVDITLTGNMLTVKGQRVVAGRGDDANVHCQERRSGPFVRVLPLPVPVDPDQVLADADNGVLHIRLNKTAQARPRQIPVQSGQPPHGTPPTM